MASVIVRPFELRDDEAAASIRSLTYNDGLPIPEERRKPRFSSSFVAEVEGQVAGVFNVLDMTASRGEALLLSGGVAGVAVSPEIRRAGVGRAMMDWLPGHLKENGVHLASLYAFRETFYAKSGYAVVGKRLRLSVPTHRLPVRDTDLPMRRLTPADWEEIHECHSQFAHQRSGVHVRSELMWERVLNENKSLTIYAAGMPIEGYVAVSHQVAFWNEQWLSEVAWSTPRGYDACLAIMRQLGINKSHLAWHEPSDSPYYAQYMDQGVETKVERQVMFRVCDVPGALQALRPEEEGEFTIRIADSQVRSNAGPWRVIFSPRGVHIEPTTNADLEIDIRPFSQAFMGDPSLRELALQGRVTVHHRAALRAAEKLLTPSPVFCSDFF